MTEEQKMSKKIEMLQLLSQNDYAARKIVFELAEKFKELYPEIDLPEYEKYKNMEEKAKEFRKVLDDLSSF